MDPLSITAAVVALIGAANAAWKIAVRFRKSYYKARDQMKSLEDTLLRFGISLGVLKRNDIASWLRENGFPEGKVKFTLERSQEVVEKIRRTIDLCQKDHASWGMAGAAKVREYCNELFQYEREIVPLAQSVSV